MGRVKLCLLLLILCSICACAQQIGSAGIGQSGGPVRSRAPLTLHVDADTVSIVRDAYGVPHVFASTERGLFYGNGYAVAADRLWQMERYRRDARGTLAEIEGKQALARDREMRRIGYTADELNSLFQGLPPEQRRLWEAYRDGVNAYLEQATAERRLPEGYAKAGIRPAPWDTLDSVAIGVIMAQRFGSAGGQEAQNQRLLTRLRQKFGETEGYRIFNDLLWRNDPKAPTTIGNEDMPKPPDKSGDRNNHAPASERDLFDEEYADPIIAHMPGAPSFAGAEPRSLRLVDTKGRAESRPSERALLEAESRLAMRDVLAYAETHQLPTRLGSYAIAIGPSRSLSRNPLLVAGPQMGWTTPQIAHEIHLSGAGYDVIGMGFAGVPGVLIGHNADLAWTATSGLDDEVDTYAEKLQPNDRRRYEFRGRVRAMDCRTEVIRVRSAEPENLEVCRTTHGPVVAWDEQAGVAYSRKAAYEGHELESFKAFLGLSRAKTVREAAQFASLMWLSQNILAADRNGDIGYWHCGRFPIRPPKFDPRLPLPGTGEAEWAGVSAFETNPQAINPARGYIVNWNNKPVPWFDNNDRPVWGEVFRVMRVRELIEAEPKHTVESLRRILQDIASNDPNAAYFRPHLLGAVERAGVKDPELQMAAEYVRAWNGHGEDESVGKTVFDTWFRALRRVLFQEELGTALAGDLAEALQPSFILHVLEGEKSAVPPRHDYLRGRTHDQVVLEAFRAAVEELKQRSPRMYEWAFRAPLNTQFAPLPPVPEQNRGTYIQIVELGPRVRAISILPPGQSENPSSPNYSDQLGLASWWKFKPLITDRAVLEK